MFHVFLNRKSILGDLQPGPTQPHRLGPTAPSGSSLAPQAAVADERALRERAEAAAAEGHARLTADVAPAPRKFTPHPRLSIGRAFFLNPSLYVLKTTDGTQLLNTQHGKKIGSFNPLVVGFHQPAFRNIMGG